MVLNSVVQLQVFEILANAGPGAQLSAAQIVSHMTEVTNPDAPSVLDRMLRLLAQNDLLKCSLVGENFGSQVTHYGLTPVGKLFATDQDGGSLAPLMSLFQDKIYLDSWFELKNAVLEGGVPFERAHGKHVFEYPRTDPRYNEVFNKAMTGQATIVMKEFLKQYRGFEDVKKLVDIGGGSGVALRMIVSKYPSIKGINFDLRHVLENAPYHPSNVVFFFLPFFFSSILFLVVSTCVGVMGLVGLFACTLVYLFLSLFSLSLQHNRRVNSGVEHVGGDMFESVPKGDAIFLKGILHEWSDSHCLKLLKNCHKALPKKGKVIVVEQIVAMMADEATSSMSKVQSDVMTLTHTPGGKERNQNQLFALANAAGFRGGFGISGSACNYMILEFLM